MSVEDFGGLPEYQNLYGEAQWLVDLIVAKMTKIYGTSFMLVPWVLEFIMDKPLTIANNPHSLDRFGYRLDGENWWL